MTTGGRTASSRVSTHVSRTRDRRAGVEQPSSLMATPSGATETTYEEVVAHFAGRSQRASHRLAEWRADPGKRDEVVPFVEAARTASAYRLGPDDVAAVAEATEHALGEAKRSIAESVIPVRDWHPSFAFEHVLHYAAETLGSIPTYGEFRTFCRDDAAARRMLLAPARAARDQAAASGYEADHIAQALRWRVGNAYYSYLKEIYALSVLRSAGIDARYHVLADVLFRTDLWVGELCLSIYVSNTLFKAGVSGRKPKAEEVLGDGPFRFARLEIPARPEFGTVHLPDPGQLVRVVRQQLDAD
jgi:hypothetical protein